jgi:Uncharacterized protein conserved in bacteria
MKSLRRYGRLIFATALILAAVLCTALAGCAEKPLPIGGEDLAPVSRQLLLVVAEDWQYTEARMQRYERDSASEDWRPVGVSFAVNLGRGGLGWGRGLHGLALGAGPVKREGDGRAPAGLFTLDSGFAVDPAEVGQTRLPTVRTDERLVCVDDENSPDYNRIVEQTGPAAWKSAENMLRKDEQYRLGVVVGHNTTPPVPGGGSCIFLHVWRARGMATSGCTSMEAANMLQVLRWLDAGKHPVLAQLPYRDYQRLRTAWRLPDLRP